MTYKELRELLHGGIRHADRKTFKAAYGMMRAIKKVVLTYREPGNDLIRDVLWDVLFCDVPTGTELMLGQIIFRDPDVKYPAIENKSKWLLKVNCKGDSRRFVRQEDLERKLRLDIEKGIM
ncbi:hypothetical protein RJ142_CDS0031 [Klebsiella phage EKq1]|nr:hypothetical protein S8c_00008 [Klebsiella phage VLCpiS8c]WNV46700.1 hypothetical protein RJ142_CDS0031 [Klebsiella phage EKq1]